MLKQILQYIDGDAVHVCQNAYPKPDRGPVTGPSRRSRNGRFGSWTELRVRAKMFLDPEKQNQIDFSGVHEDRGEKTTRRAHA